MADRKIATDPNYQPDGTPGEPLVERGWVKWPRQSDQFEETDEGGMAVYAVFPNREEWSACTATPAVTIRLTEAVDPEEALKKEIGSKAMLAAICLGTTNGSWYDNDARGPLWAGPEVKGQVWQASQEDILPEGKVVLSVLHRLYGVEPIFVTILDT